MKNIRGTVNHSPGMRLDLRENSKVKVNMPNHVQIIPETAPMDIDGLVETPADNYIFQVREDGNEL